MIQIVAWVYLNGAGNSQENRDLATQVLRSLAYRSAASTGARH